MITYLIGQLLEVEPVETQKKGSRDTSVRTELTVQFDGISESGYLKRSTETISFDDDDYDVLDRFEPLIGRTVAVPYRTIQNQRGTWVFPDTTLPVFDFDKAIFDFSPFKKERIKNDAKLAAKAS